MKGMIESDLTGLHQQHASAHTSFNDMLRLVILIEALPWIAVGTFAASDQNLLTSLSFFNNLPGILVFVLCFSGVAGLVGLQIIVHNRMNIIYYARAINGYRKIYSAEYPEVEKILPVSSKIPPAREKRGIMTLVAVSLAVVNAFYLSLSTYNLSSNNLILAIIIFFLILLFALQLYLNITDHFIVNQHGIN